MRANLGHHWAQAANVAVGGKQFQTVINSSTGTQQQAEIAREDRHVFGTRLIEQSKAAPRCRIFDGECIDKDKTQSLNTPRYLAG